MSDVVDRLEAQIAGLDLMAEEAEAVAAHFRPQFEACWTKRPDGSLLDLTDRDTALRLRPYVLDRETEARRFRREADDLREAVTHIEAGDAMLMERGERDD